MNINFAKKYKFNINFMLLKFLIFVILFLTIFGSTIFAQQIGFGFNYDFIPFQYTNISNSIKTNNFYDGFLFFIFKVSDNQSFGFLISRCTYNPNQPNSLSINFNYIGKFISISEYFKLMVSDSINNIFPYFENRFNILFDLYPIFYIDIDIQNPIYIQNIFYSLSKIPDTDTFEKYRFFIETGFYIYQMSIGLSFYYNILRYNFDIENEPITYNKLQTYDGALVVKYIPTFTLFGFEVNFGYSYNSLTTKDNTNYIHQYIYAKARLIFNLNHIKIEPNFGYLIYSIYSNNITDLSQLSRLSLGFSLSYIF